MVLGTEEELFTKFPQRRGCPPGSKNKKALKKYAIMPISKIYFHRIKVLVLY